MECEDFGDQKFRSDRRAKTFPVFTANTDSKDFTVNVSAAFLNTYLPGLLSNLSCDLVDLGTGDGELAKKVATYLYGVCKTEKINHYGIELNKKLLDSANSNLKTMNFVNSQIIHGNCFSDKVDLLPNNSVLLMASHVIYYSDKNGTSDFIQKILKKTGLASIIVAQASGSVLNSFSNAYSHSSKIKNTETIVEQELELHSLNFSHIKIYFSSYIFFPYNISKSKLHELSRSNFTELSGEDYNTRALLEFIAGSPLEYLNCLNASKLDHFIEDTYTHLISNNYKVQYWNYLIIVVPSDNLNQERMNATLTEIIHGFKLSGNVSAFISATREGNFLMAYSLYKQGIMSCKLQTYQNANSFKKKIYELFKYNLKLKLLGSEFFKYPFQIPPENNFEFINYNSSEMTKMQSKEYNFNTYYDIPNNAKSQNTNFSARGESYRKWLSNKLGIGFINDLAVYDWAVYIIFEIVLAGPLLLPIFYKASRESMFLQALGLNFIFHSFWCRFLFTNNLAIHHIPGDDILLQFYFLDENNLDSLGSRNADGQNSLLIAAAKNDSLKVDNLLACDNSVVAKIISTRDYQGFSAIHYACKNGNQKIVKNLIEKGAEVNLPAGVDLINFVSDSIFFIGKITYLHGYLVNREFIYDPLIFQFPIIPVIIYAGAEYFKCKFPDYIYFQLFQNRLNPFDTWEVPDKIQQIYEGYSYDTALHLSVKYNHSAIVKYLVRNNALVDALNAKGESALHLAAARDNLEILELLIKNNVNYQTVNGKFFPLYDLPFYPTLDLLLQIFLLFLGSNNLPRAVAEVLFLKITHNEVFGSFHAVHKATPLHYAVFGVGLSDLNFKSDKITPKKIMNHEAIVKLIENGANPDLTMSYYRSPDEQLLPYVITKIITYFYPASYLFSIPIMLLLNQFFSPYNSKELKPIDLVEQRDSDLAFNYLKQFTTVNKKASYFEYLLKIFSGQTISEIPMKEFGVYQAQTAKNKFIVYQEFKGKEQGFKLIIKDFSENDCIALFGFEEVCLTDLTFEKVILNKQDSIIVKVNDLEIVTLLGNQNILSYEDLSCNN